MGLAERFVSYGTLLTIICLLYAVYKEDPTAELQERLIRVINGLIHVEHQHIKVKPKVVIGYGACVDLFVDGTDLLPYSDEIGLPEHFENIVTFEELQKSFAYYFQHGAASERYIANITLFDQLVNRAVKLPNARWNIGGNAPSMAMRLFAEGCDVTLASSLTPQYLKVIPSGIKVVSEPVSRDDIHLIMEYKAQETWGPYTSPRANRYIAHHDIHNPHVTTLEALGREVVGATPDLFVVSGLQLMDNFHFSSGVRSSRLRQIMKQMRSFPQPTKVHFEMASFTEERLLKDLQQYIIPFTDSLGMNEQELDNLYHLYRYGNISYASNSTPRVATVLDQMRFIFKSIRSWSRLTFGSKRLTRIHLHTLAFQVVLTEKNSKWRQNDVAAAKASLTAFRHVCDSSQVEIDRAKVLLDESFSLSVIDNERRIQLEPEVTAVPCWEETETNICVAPGLVCTKASKTAGGGDNISAAALAVQL